MSSVSGLRKAKEFGSSIRQRELAGDTTAGTTRRIVAFSRYSRGSASSRVRIHQFAESIQKEGWIFEVHDFVDDEFTKSRYGGKTNYLSIPGMFLRRAHALIRARRADLIWIQREAMPWMPFWLEKLFLAKKPTVYDFDDAIHIQYLRHRSKLVRFFLGSKVAQIAKRANCLTVGNLELKQYMEQMGATDVVLVPSVIDSIPGDGPKTQLCTRPFIVCYTGNIYEEFQDPEPLFQALNALKSSGDISESSVIVKFFGTRLDRVQELALDERYSDFIRIEGHVSREAALTAQREADLLLLLENASEDSRGILTGKLFEYLVSGTPVLCIGSRPEFEIGQILYSTGAGVVVSPENFQRLPALLSATLGGGGVFEEYHPNFQEIRKYSRETQATELFDTIVERMRQRSK